MKFSLKQLRGIDIEELISEHDKLAEHLVPSVNYYLEEISRRDQDKQTKAMLSYTKYIFWFTAIVTIATIVNIIVAL